jgi:hypothetical protein
VTCAISTDDERCSGACAARPKHGGPRQGRDAQMEANSFASSFLMPKADVKSRLPFVGRLDDLVGAKKKAFLFMRWPIVCTNSGY